MSKRPSDEGDATSSTSDDASRYYGSVECVGFAVSHEWAASGGVGHGNTEMGSLCIWDLKVQRVRTTSIVNAGITRLEWHPSQPLVYACALDGLVRMWDARSGSLTRVWTGHRNSILGMCMLWDGGDSTKPFALTASDDHSAKIFALDGGDKSSAEEVIEAE